MAERLFFDVRLQGEPSVEYVAWVDVMGTQGALERSTKVAANFIYKLHIAVLRNQQEGVGFYPLMD